MRDVSVVHKTTVPTWSDFLSEVAHDRSAVSTGNHNARPLYITLTTPIHDVHPLALFSLNGNGDGFYWATPDRRTLMSAIGVVTEFQASGPNRFNCLRLNLRDNDFVGNPSSLPPPYGQSPMLYGGFAFSPESGVEGASPAWSEFPDGLLVLPTFTVLYHDGHTWLRQTTRFHPGKDDVDSLAARLDEKRNKVYDHLLARSEPEGVPANEAQRIHSMPMDISFDESEMNLWTQAVKDLTAQARAGSVIKTVLSRHMDVPLPRPIVLPQLLERLEHEHPQSFIFALTRRGHTFLGATPERLLRVEGRQLRSEALAGSTRRGITESEDKLLAHRLLHNDKERHEQHIVLEWITERLQKWCSTLEAPRKPTVVRFPKVQHLHTPVTGELKESAHILELVEAIHPTPAVGGYPLDAALKLIATHEQENRGWYAGPIGWASPSGSGEFAVGIRSALLDENRARLFAGCGIVDGSEPKKELAEARLKLGVIFDSLVRALS